MPAGNEAAAAIGLKARPRYHVASEGNLHWARPPYGNKDLGAGTAATWIVCPSRLCNVSILLDVRQLLQPGCGFSSGVRATSHAAEFTAFGDEGIPAISICKAAQACQARTQLVSLIQNLSCSDRSEATACLGPLSMGYRV